MPPSEKPVQPDWAKKIKALRRYLRADRAQFARNVAYPVEKITLWEQGIEEPSSAAYVTLGNLAGEPSCWYFWTKSRLYRDNPMPVLPSVELHEDKKSSTELQGVRAGIRRLFSQPLIQAIPLLPLNAAAYGIEGDKSLSFDQSVPEGLIAAPSHWAPNPAFTKCLRVRGDSMAPVLRDGFIIAIDSSRIDPEKLENQVVVAWHPQKGMTVCWLRSVEGQQILIPESANYGSTKLTKDSGWRIIAEVLWWIGKTNH